ncbi:MAG TPA: T9SS type A sorting domain-containing protein, partial [Chitinophagaceae bacterium]|nr:T9SS type A sorting domain-containing protein [Chitinophagaceae bacterium]
LENGQYTGNANNASNWFAGCPEGSPGFAYNPACYPVGVSNVKDEWFIKIVPNPVHDVLRIYSSMDIDEIVLTDLSGRIVFSTKEAVHEIDMQNYSSGTYLLRCKSQGRYWNCKVIRQ